MDLPVSSLPILQLTEKGGGGSAVEKIIVIGYFSECYTFLLTFK